MISQKYNTIFIKNQEGEFILKCKKCGHEIDRCHYTKTNQLIQCYKNRKENPPSFLLHYYADLNYVALCNNCSEPIDYIDLPMEIFFNWLRLSSKAGDSRSASGKAIIRYFEVEKLLKEQSERMQEGDENTIWEK